MEGSFSRMSWVGIAQMARALDHVLILFPGHNPENPISELRHRNFIYNFLSPNVIDALILQPSTWRNFISEKKFKAYISHFCKQFPVVSLDERLKQCPSLQVDNAQGIKDGVRHLFKEHNCRKIGFLSGPEKNEEARQRLAAFQDALAEYGLPQKKRWIYPGDFMVTSGRQWALEHGGHIQIDALFCSNDNMALGVLEGLNQRGLPVPETLRVFGFDDKEESRFQRIPLSTVRQPLQKMGLEAFRTAVDLLNGRLCPPYRVFEPELRLRDSCGCSSSIQKHQQMTKYYDAVSQSSLLESFIRNDLARFLLEDDIKRISYWVYNLMDLIMSKPPTEDLVQKLLDDTESFIKEELFHRGTLLDWQNLFSFIYMISKKFSTNHVLYAHYDFFQKARIIVGEQKELYQGIERNAYYRYLDNYYRTFSTRVMICRSVAEILDVLEEYLPLFEIEDFYLVLFEDSPSVQGPFSEIPEKSRLLFSLCNGKTEYKDAGGELFDTLDFLPGDWNDLSGGAYTIMPLFFDEKSLGYSFSQVSNIDSRANTDLQVFLSLALSHVD